MLIRLILWITNFDWSRYRQATCLPNHCFCEAIGAGFIRQPIDTYTNIAYLLAGIFILHHLVNTKTSRERISNQTSLPRMLFALFGLTVIAVSIGSFLYHASFTFLGMEMDDDSMYLIGTFMLFYGLAHLIPINTKKFLFAFILLNLFLETVIYFFPVIRGLIFGLLVLGSLWINWIAIRRKKMKNNLKPLFTSLGIFALAYFVWTLDDLKIVCYPTSLFQGHGVWHCLTALAIVFYFQFMDSEFNKVFLQ